jgi:hypothetical protein
MHVIYITDLDGGAGATRQVSTGHGALRAKALRAKACAHLELFSRFLCNIRFNHIINNMPKYGTIFLRDSTACYNMYVRAMKQNGEWADEAVMLASALVTASVVFALKAPDGVHTRTRRRAQIQDFHCEGSRMVCIYVN